MNAKWKNWLSNWTEKTSNELALRTKEIEIPKKALQKNHMKPRLLLLLYLFAVTLPLAVSRLVGGPPRVFWQELASGLGILAFSIILVEFVLSGRFKSISNGVGMDVTMRVHQMMARIALVFALLHPLLYQGTPSGGPRPWDPTRQLTITTDLASLSTGILAFVLLPSLVLLAIGRTQLDYKYETWRLMHGIGALLIAALLLHHSVYAGRYGSQPAMTWLWSVMTGVSVGSLIYVYLIQPLRKLRRPWHVISVTRLAQKQWQLTVSPKGHAGLDYQAGQFVWLNVGHSPFSVKENPFSISSAPNSGPDVSFIIKELGDFSQTVGQIEIGSRAYLDGPFGSLTVEGRTEPGIAFIAGGVGISPLLGIVRQMRLTKDPRRVKLIYGNRVVDQIVCRQDLDLEDVTYVLSEPPEDWEGEVGLIDTALLDRVFSSQEKKEWLFVMCGPAVMMDLVEGYLVSSGTPSNRILSERFDYD
ncbi:ferredoxin reductase family protein [Pelagimonas varians]|uniref:Methane monooxygenase component C n=1 Tax=Pelagimonas varians TaxID=696760 RepID=A0A238L4F9_9RHOB|nr:ferredoxin reductase family protein [Pelagimonas varians]PYG25589.1 putative ferric reductase [Pelagimonas varians]SMX49909.1 Methane monooxygenase component C [Pelagimonas varians]